MINEVLDGASSMKVVCLVINDRDEELFLPINVLKPSMTLFINIRRKKRKDDTDQVSQKCVSIFFHVWDSLKVM